MKGKVASEGMAFAVAYPIREPEIKIEKKKTDDPQGELERFENARAYCADRLEQLISDAERRQNQDAGDILEFQLLFLEDTDYLGKIEKRILQERWNSEYAVSEVLQGYRRYLSGLTDNPYLQERAVDVDDLARRLLYRLMGIDDALQEPEEPYIAVAEDLSPSQVMAMDVQKLKGIVLEKGSLTAHAVIIAKSRGIPCLIGVGGAMAELPAGKPVLLDCFESTVLPNPDEKRLSVYRRYSEVQAEERKLLKTYQNRETQTRDGYRMKVYANIASWQEASELVRQGGEGVGLFRTELLYIKETSAPPSEDVQYDVYRQTAENLAGRPLIIRTLDAGGDKQVPYLGMPPETNPFLGYRAIRFCLEHPTLFSAQLSAILRASAHGPISIMFPMICAQEELAAARRILEETKERLHAQGFAFDPQIPVGMMVETPAAAMDASRFAKLVDFFSIGTNDLSQYLFAADRSNDKVSGLNSYFQPCLLRCIRQIADSAHAAGIEVDICGQAGEVLELVPLWIGMGIDSLSVSIPMIPKVRHIICEANKADCERLLSRVLDLDTRADVQKALEAGTI